MKRPKLGPMTNKEFGKLMANNTEYQAMRREKDARIEKLRQETAADERELVEQCRAVGEKLDSVWDFVNTYTSYYDAIPILVEHLKIPHHPRIREGIVRALCTDEGKGIATQALIDEFLATPDPESELKWLLGKSIAETATAESLEQVIGLIRDESHGRGRYFLPLALLQMSTEEAKEALAPMLNDPVLSEQAKRALDMLGKKTRRRKGGRESN